MKSLDDGAFGEQLQLQVHNNSCLQPGITGSVQNSNSSTGSNISFVGLSYANQTALQKPEEVSSREDGSVSQPALGSQSCFPKVSLGVMKMLPAARNCDPQDHIMAERKRREKLSQRFIALSAMVPGLQKVWLLFVGFLTSFKFRTSIEIIASPLIGRRSRHLFSEMQ